MGQYLAIGLVGRILVRHRELEHERVDWPAVWETLVREWHLDPVHWSPEENEQGHCMVWNHLSAGSALIPFLEEFYAQLDVEPESLKQSLDALRASPPEEWLDLAREKQLYQFQWDSYAHETYVEIPTTFRPTVSVGFETVSLYTCGKIIMECYHDLFRFFDMTMRKYFSHHGLDLPLKTYITG